jgi:two-component system sensor histidine kinase KdpD
MATVLLWPVKESIGLLNIGLVFLIVVIGATVFAGQRAGIIAALLGFALFNFFLVPPYFTFEVEDLANILALFVFLGVSSLISWLIAGGREQARQAQIRAEDLSRLYELSQSIIGARNTDEVLTAIAQKAADVFEAQACWLLRPNAQMYLTPHAQAPEGVRPLTRAEIALAEWAFTHSSQVVQTASQKPQFRGKAPGERTTFVPLRAGARAIGVLGIADKTSGRPFTTAERTVLATFADQAAVALERLYLLQEAERAEILARSDELKSALVSTVSHDLRTTLASIMASVTSLLEPGIAWGEDTQREFLQSIYDEARRLDKLVSNLLDMSRIESGELRPEKDWYSIDEVIEAVTQRLESRATEHQLTVQIAENLPMVMLDFTQIDQVITNIVQNAIKYTPPGTLIHIDARQIGEYVQVTVADSGPGVPAEQLPKLFTKFFRVDGRTQVKGMGLGLAISKGLVEAHGGRIGAKNKAGGGLEITFALPITAANVVTDAGEGGRGPHA